LPAFSILFAPVGLAATAGIVLASVGICAVGALASAMAAAARSREILLPLILLPLSIPLIVGGVGSGVSTDPGRYLTFLGLYDAVFALLSWAAFEYVVTE
jgi:heme exporter protein B